ncbi:Histidine phosphatase superfamily [Tylopilus felleus]
MGLNDPGNISPYHDTPAVPGMPVDLPDDCIVGQAILLLRHGSHGLVEEQKYILGFVDTLHKAGGKIQAADLPPYLEFLKAGYEYQLVPEALTIRIFTPFSTDDVISTTVPRVRLLAFLSLVARQKISHFDPARDNSPWCNVFVTDESKGLEYEQDLLLDNYSGHKSRGDPGPLAGAFYVKKFMQRLTDTADDTKHLYLDFAHDTSILFALSALGLNKDAVPLNLRVDHPPADRKFRSSNQMLLVATRWERFTCKNSYVNPLFKPFAFALTASSFEGSPVRMVQWSDVASLRLRRI